MSGDGMTLQQAAAFLGVHYMTVYRYVRLGLLPARKDGASWRVERADLEMFKAAAEGVAANGRPAGRRRAPWADRLEARLLAGDSRGAWGVVESSLAAGTDVASVYLDVLSPALTSIGSRWASGEIDVAAEHRASGIAMRIIGRLGPRFARRGRTRGTIVLGAPPGDHHSLPVALLADLLRAAGWEVHDLGADVPIVDFVGVASATPRLAAVGVSVMASACLESAREAVASLRAVVPPAVPVLLGGLAVPGEAEARALGADAWASDGRQVVALVDRLSARRAGVVAGDILP
jgi:excisionase family DNA binding protein